MFTPFGGGVASGLASGLAGGLGGGLGGVMPPGFVNPFAPPPTVASAAKPANPERGASSRDDLQALKEQMAAMQEKLEALNRS